MMILDSEVFASMNNLVGGDFEAPSLLRLLYAPTASYDTNLRASIKAAFLDWSYWVDLTGGSPGGGIGQMQPWTENHAILFHTSEYDYVPKISPYTSFPIALRSSPLHKDECAI